MLCSVENLFDAMCCLFELRFSPVSGRIQEEIFLHSIKHS
jgi:hypothetical protein